MEQIVINDYFILMPIMDNKENKIVNIILGEYDSPIGNNNRGAYPEHAITFVNRNEIDDVIDVLDSFRTEYFSK